jgi:ABC-type Mn2+/Zn2+ transport system ATPase subunit
MVESIKIDKLSFNIVKKHFLLGRKAKKRIVFDSINLELKPNSYSLIKGNNGSGKSSLISVILYERVFERNWINTLINNDSYINNIKGSVLFFNNDNINENVFDLYAKSTKNNEKTRNLIEKNISAFRGSRREKELLVSNDFTMTGHQFLKQDGNNKSNLVKKLYDHFDYNDIKDLSLSKMSDGQLNLTFLLKTFLKDTFLYIFDEPLNALDDDRARKFNEYLVEITKNHNKAVLVVSHCFNHLTPDPDNVYLLNSKKSNEVFGLEKIPNYKKSIKCSCIE